MPHLLNLELASQQAPDIVARLQQAVLLCEWFVGSAVDAPDDLNVDTVLILGRMAKLGGPVRACELRSKGFYAGSNASHNIKLLTDRKYIKSERNQLDRRSVTLTLTKKGLAIGEPAAQVIQYLEKNIGPIFSFDVFVKTRGFLGESLHNDLELYAPVEKRVTEPA